MIRKDRSFCDQNLQFVAILDKNRKILSLLFATLILLFSKLFCIVIFHSVVAFQQYQIYYFSKCLKSYNDQKNWCNE